MRIKIRDFLTDMFDFFTIKRLFSFLGKNWVILVAFFVMACVIGFYFFQFSPYDLSKGLCINTTGDEADCLSKDAARWGTFGDFFGGTLNPILSFLALMVLLRTFSMQREELDLQREELKETKIILKEQSETQKRQRFESTFFELLKVHNQELENLCKDELKLQEIFRYIDDYSLLSDAKSMLQTQNHLCGHYFQVLYQLLKFIAVHSDNTITDVFEIEDIKRDNVGKNEKMYSNIVRALLPDKIMKLLAINCYSEENDTENYWKYKLLIERYSLFKHASFASANAYQNGIMYLTDAKGFENQEGFYKPKAFGK